MNKVITEAIGTFFLVFAVVGAVAQATPLAAFAIGGMLAVAVYAGGHISGAHYNPAVSIAAFIRGRLPGAELPAYIGAQLVGASLASLLAAWVFRSPTPPAIAWSGRTLIAALVVEALFTFFLAFVVLNVATSKDHPDNSFYGLAIGGTVLAGILLVGSISGAAFNPAVALGVTLAKLSAWGNLWAYVVAQVVGGALAAVAFRALNPDDE
ncbi:MAG TPA: aquaporin [Aeromicrobium sp.]|nr:aquaporin [Aeromicrobium sp.]